MGTKTVRPLRMMMSVLSLVYTCAILARTRSFSLLQNVCTSSGTNPDFLSLTNESYFLPWAHNQSAATSPSSQSVPSYPSHPPLTFPSSSAPFHNISSVSSNAMDIHHFLKPFIVTSGQMCCHSPLIHID
jgi:hypothetical protein